MGDVADLLRESVGRCPPAERKVARALLADYPATALISSASLAAVAQVSTPTVTRLIARMGFESYRTFQQRVRDELSTTSPVALYSAIDFAAHATTEPAALMTAAAEQVVGAVRETFASLPAGELSNALDLLADTRRRVFVHGGRFSGVFAEYLLLHLVQVREGAARLPASAVERSATLSGLRRNDLVVLFDYRRYEPVTLQIARLAAGRHAQVLLLTDPWLSPVSGVADVVLTTQVTSPSPYDSLVALAAVVETIVTGLLARLGDGAHRRMQHVEDCAREWNLYQDE